MGAGRSRLSGTTLGRESKRMSSLFLWLARVEFGMLVALALIVLGLRGALRAVALGYTVALLAGLPITLRSELPAVIFAMPGVLLSVLGAALLRKLPGAQGTPRRVMSIAIGVVLGALGGFVACASVTHAVSPWWVVLILGAGAGACWGILAPSVIRPNKPLQPTSGGERHENAVASRDAARS